MKLEPIIGAAAPIFLVIGIAAIVDQYIPGFSVPGEPLTWAAFSIACALVGGKR